VLDLACGRGRHALASAELGARVVALDRDRAALAALRNAARQRHLPIYPVRTDLESGQGIPIRSGSCGAILVFCFLFRALAPGLRDLLAPGGLLLYETFTTRQPELGWGPRNPDFLLRPGELRELFPDLVVLHYWEGLTEGDRPAAVAQLVARVPQRGAPKASA
jgi:SAM-dependent methyltransferase